MNADRVMGGILAALLLLALVFGGRQAPQKGECPAVFHKYKGVTCN